MTRLLIDSTKQRRRQRVSRKRDPGAAGRSPSLNSHKTIGGASARTVSILSSTAREIKGNIITRTHVPHFEKDVTRSLLVTAEQQKNKRFGQVDFRVDSQGVGGRRSSSSSSLSNSRNSLIINGLHPGSCQNNKSRTAQQHILASQREILLSDGSGIEDDYRSSTVGETKAEHQKINRETETRDPLYTHRQISNNNKVWKVGTAV